MTISKDNVRVNVTINKELKKKAQEEAKLQQRSLSNFINFLLIEYFKQKKN